MGGGDEGFRGIGGGRGGRCVGCAGADVACGAERGVFDFELAACFFETGKFLLHVLGSEGSRCDGVADHGLQPVEFLGAHVEIVLQSLILAIQVPLDRFDLGLERRNHGINRLDRREQILRKPRQSRRHNLQRRQHLPINQGITIRPLPPTDRTQLLPQQQQQLVTLLQLIPSRLLERRQAPAVLAARRLELRDANVLRAGRAREVLMGALEGVVLRLGVAVRDAFLFEELGELAALEGVGLEEGVALFDDAVLFDEGCFASVEFADRVFKLALEFGDGLKMLVNPRKKSREHIP